MVTYSNIKRRIVNNEYSRIYTNDFNLERIQENIQTAVQDLVQPTRLGIPTYINTDNCSAKLGDIVLLQPSDNINVSLQKVTKNDIGKHLIIKNYSAETKNIVIYPYPGGSIDGQTSITMNTPYDFKMLLLIESNEWISLIF